MLERVDTRLAHHHHSGRHVPFHVPEVDPAHHAH